MRLWNQHIPRARPWHSSYSARHGQKTSRKSSSKCAFFKIPFAVLRAGGVYHMTFLHRSKLRNHYYAYPPRALMTQKGVTPNWRRPPFPLNINYFAAHSTQNLIYIASVMINLQFKTNSLKIGSSVPSISFKLWAKFSKKAFCWIRKR